MFYIHGGAFSARSGNIDTFGPEFFMDYGVVMVIADYRYVSVSNLNCSSGYSSRKLERIICTIFQLKLCIHGDQ